jgi:hypothetical protein
VYDVAMESCCSDSGYRETRNTRNTVDVRLRWLSYMDRQIEYEAMKRDEMRWSRRYQNRFSLASTLQSRSPTWLCLSEFDYSKFL